MKKKDKLTILSVLTSAVILTSSIPVNTTTNKYISSYYDVLMEDITTDYSLIAENVNFIPSGNYIPQGIAVTEEFVLVSSYDYFKDRNSIISIYDKDGNFINKCLLDNDAHVGGLAYDSRNNIVWVTSYYGCIDGYSLEDLINSKKAIPLYKDILVGEGLPNYRYSWLDTASFLAFHNDELLVGNFSLMDKGKVKRYVFDIKEDKVILRYKGSFMIPDKVQGITFHKKNNKEYMLMSRSYGQHIPSLLQVFKYDDDIKDYTKNGISTVIVKMPPMMEQVVSRNNQLYTLYESNAKIYNYRQDDDFDSIPVVEVDELVKRLENKK